MIIVTNRGPERFEATDDGFVRKRGAGGVVSALRPLLAGGGATWVAGAVDAGDRAAIAAGAAHSDDFDLHLLALDEREQHLHYHVVSNAVLWFVHHGLFDLPRRPSFDERIFEAWDAYRSVNRRFADEVAGVAPEGDVVLVHDYHFTLVPGMLHERRPDLEVVFFQHTPFCGPNSIRVLPEAIAAEMLDSMAHVPTGFHTSRWAAAYEASSREVRGADAATVPAFSASLGIDTDALDANARSDETVAEGEALDEIIGDRKVIIRVDRIEPSKNIVRGFLAYDRLLDRHPEWRERVVFLALVYPSREGLAEYLAYRQEVEQAADRVNARWATGDWTPIVLDTHDTYSRSLAGLRRYDVLLVNPIKDGLNLVAKEGCHLNANDGVLALSREAGAFDELGDAALAVHPYDLVQTAEALHEGLAMDEGARRERSQRLRDLASARSARDWLDDLVARARA